MRAIIHSGTLSRSVTLGLILAVVGLVGCATKAAAPASGPADAEPAEAAADGLGLGAVSELDGEDLHGIPVARAEELLEGRVAGVQVLRTPGGGIEVRIRGRGSIQGNNEPLYVVDGMPINHNPGRGLNWLNPGDILRIQVLKDASETSFYGVRGANGVVLITTRRGR